MSERRIIQVPRTYPDGTKVFDSIVDRRLLGRERRGPHVITDSRRMRKCLAVCYTDTHDYEIHAPGCPTLDPMRSSEDRRGKR